MLLLKIRLHNNKTALMQAVDITPINALEPIRLVRMTLSAPDETDQTSVGYTKPEHFYKGTC